MSTETVTQRVSDSMLDAAAAVEENVTQAESAVNDAARKAENLSVDAQEKAVDTLKTVENYIREKPVHAAGIAFAAGLLTALIIRK